MRLDYLLYLLAAVFFIITAVSLVFLMDQMQKSLWVVTTVVLGLASIGLGYYQRPKAKIESVQPVQLTPQSEFAEAGNVNVKEANVAENAQRPAEPVPMEMAAPIPAPDLQKVEKSIPFESDLTLVKGIGERRAAQLKELGINSLDELAKVSADDLAKDLGISPKITRKWVASAKESHK
jgi:predicted flap endonuclease-1-like 5' DNA nuclease